MTARRVAVIGGGSSCEHEVSLASAAGVASALESAGHEVTRLTIARDGGWLDDHGERIGLEGAVVRLRDSDVVLPIVHGPLGEDGALAALCELVGVPYAGCPPTAGAVAMDKWLTKLVAQAVGVATAPGVLVRRGEQVVWPGPCVVKPVCAGSSHGVSLVAEEAGLADALAAAFALDDRVLVEEVVRGQEVDVAVLDLTHGDRYVPPLLEIVTDGIFDLVEKYDGSADFRIPARLTTTQEEQVRAAALAVYDALGCRGLARVDFFVTATGPVLNEVNTMPGMTPHSQVPRMLAAGGLPYADALDILMDVALRAREGGQWQRMPQT